MDYVFILKASLFVYVNENSYFKYFLKVNKLFVVFGGYKKYR
jgi:hypothetical protein